MGRGAVDRGALGPGAAWAHRGRIVEATVLMAVGAAAQKWVPMPRWSAVLGEHGQVPDAWRGQAVTELRAAAEDPVERGVAVAIDRSMAHLPVEPSCLAQAFAGQAMLRRRGGGGVVVIGLRRGSSDVWAWDAHAWLLGRAGALTGGSAAQGFTATTVFQTPGGLQADEVDLGGPVERE